MKNKKFASFLAAAAALVLLAMPAFAADEQTEEPFLMMRKRIS